jgi:hypothetical protein
MMTFFALVLLWCMGIAAIVTPWVTDADNPGLQRIGVAVVATALILTAIVA